MTAQLGPRRAKTAMLVVPEGWVMQHWHGNSCTAEDACLEMVEELVVPELDHDVYIGLAGGRVPKNELQIVVPARLLALGCHCELLLPVHYHLARPAAQEHVALQGFRVPPWQQGQGPAVLHKAFPQPL